MNSAEAAAKYIRLGWQVVPLEPGTKACRDTDWKNLRFKPEDFKEKDNIGIRSVDDLVIIDEDAQEVIAIADHFLPDTNAIYGRESKPKSKRLFLSPGFSKILAYKDSGSSLVELRANHQDMAPPSVHPNGEVLKWDMLGKPAKVNPKELKRCVQLLATTALCIRHYNPPGARHEWSLALAGCLRQLGLTEKEATKVYSCFDDQKISDRLTELRTTYAKTEDDPIAAGRALEQISNPLFVKSLRKIWGETNLPLARLEELNAKHAVIFQQSGDITVITEDNPIRFSTFRTIQQLYPEEVIVGYNTRGTPIRKRLGVAWLESPRRRQYNGIELAPHNPTAGYFNLWKGFSVEPHSGASWDKYRAHIYEIICQSNNELFDYVVTWMAYCVQHPGSPAPTAIALTGGQGTGKTTFARWFGALFGTHFLHLDSSRHLTGNFNAHLHNAVVVLADEAAWPGDKAGIGALRRMITERTLAIERKGADILQVKNVVHLILASNADWVVPAALDERRFAVLELSKSHQNDNAWFTAIEQELFHKNGLGAMLYDLQRHPIEVELRRVPHTKALDEQKKMSASPFQKWWLEMLKDGEIWSTEFKRDEYLLDRDELYSRYVDMVDRGSRVKTEKGFKTELGMRLNKVLPGMYPRTIMKAKRRYWVIPSLDICRKKFEELFRSEIDWGEGEEELDEEIPF